MDYVEKRECAAAPKKPLVDLADLNPSTVDNVEGMTWGFRLGQGRRSLVLVSDDNVDPDLKTQLIALSIR